MTLCLEQMRIWFSRDFPTFKLLIWITFTSHFITSTYNPLLKPDSLVLIFLNLYDFEKMSGLCMSWIIPRNRTSWPSVKESNEFESRDWIVDNVSAFSRISLHSRSLEMKKSRVQFFGKWAANWKYWLKGVKNGYQSLELIFQEFLKST